MCARTYLEEVPDVDDEGAGDWLDGHPPGGALHELQAADVVLAEHGEEVAVGVRHQAEGGAVRRDGARRVPVQPEEARRLVAPLREALLPSGAAGAEGLGQHARQRAGQLRHGARHLPRHVPAASAREMTMASCNKLSILLCRPEDFNYFPIIFYATSNR